MSAANNIETNGSNAQDHAEKGNKRYDYGGNPLAREDTSDSARFPAFGGNLQPGSYRMPKNNLANPSPLGLSAFALTTFLLSLINLGTRGVTEPFLVISVAFGYGGLVQLLAGMWEMACGNTFAATALSSYGGFWISFGIIFTPGGFNIVDQYNDPMSGDALLDSTGRPMFYTAFSYYLFGWFIFTTILCIATLKSTVAFFFLFFTLALAFLCLALGYYYLDTSGAAPAANHSLNIAGGVFGILSAFAAWYNALAGILEPSNSFFLIPVVHFPWSEKGRTRRGKPTAEQVANEKEREQATATLQ